MSYKVLPYITLRRFTEMGRTRILIVCPVCQEQVWGYVWSLAGSGKKCPKCGALHTYSGTVVKIPESEGSK